MNELVRDLADYLKEVAEELIFAYHLEPEQADRVRRAVATPRTAAEFFDWIIDDINEGAASFH